MTTSTLFDNIANRRVATNGIMLNIAEQKPATPKSLVVLLHGFPESWYSWRHQFQPLADAGYHVVAPDMRGYGDSDKPIEIEAYNQFEVRKDIVGLVGALGYEQAVVIGHDWGAPTAWACALHEPDVFNAVGALSVPFSPRSDSPPLATIKKIFEGRFFYQLYFQQPGVAEAEFEADVRTSLKKFYHMASGQMNAEFLTEKSPDADLLSDFEEPSATGDWLSESDLDFYTSEFARSGFRGPLNYYRNMDLSWELTKDARRTIDQPALFLAGDKDGVIAMAGPALENMPNHVTDLRVKKLIPGIGHWTQQEAPTETNQAILSWLETLD